MCVCVCDLLLSILLFLANLCPYSWYLVGFCVRYTADLKIYHVAGCFSFLSFSLFSLAYSVSPNGCLNDFQTWHVWPWHPTFFPLIVPFPISGDSNSIPKGAQIKTSRLFLTLSFPWYLTWSARESHCSVFKVDTDTTPPSACDTSTLVACASLLTGLFGWVLARLPHVFNTVARRLCKWSPARQWIDNWKKAP